MAVQKASITTFLELAQTLPVIDVRSPGEFAHAHIPGAYSLPLFTDDERKEVGTAYKQQSREKAIKLGLDYFGPKMSGMVAQVEQWMKERKTPVMPGMEKPALLVHCWRGGMRSAGVAWLLDLYGFKVTTLAGGYKAYRQWIHAQFEFAYSFRVLGGYTGSGKTKILNKLAAAGQHCIDLEHLALHRGSAFGAIDGQPQPTQEMFENQLGIALYNIRSTIGMGADASPIVFIEDESQRIGSLSIPTPIWKQMRSCPIVFLNIPFEKRLDYLLEEYGLIKQETLVNAILRIQKRLGGLETKTAIQHLLDGDLRESFRILLQYYDKGYKKSLHNRSNLASLLQEVDGNTIENNQMVQHIIYETSSPA